VHVGPQQGPQGQHESQGEGGEEQAGHPPASHPPVALLGAPHPGAQGIGQPAGQGQGNGQAGYLPEHIGLLQVVQNVSQHGRQFHGPLLLTATFQDGGEKGIAAVHLGHQGEPFPQARDGDALLVQDSGGGHGGEIRMGGQEAVHHPVVFFPEQAASGIDQAAAGAHQTGGGGQNGGLLLVQFGQGLGGLAPFQIRIAAQGTQARTGGIHQHPVRLACQALELGVMLMFQTHGVNIGEAGAGQPGFQIGQTLFRHVAGVEAPGGTHEGPQQQGLAPRPSAEIHHHFPPLGGHQIAEELTAFVLDLETAVQEQGMAG